MVNESIKLEFKGRVRDLRFGIGPTRILCEDRGINVSEMQNLDLNELIQDLIVASLKMECLVSDTEVDFNKYEVYQWITDMEQETFQQIFDIFIKTRTVGRSIYDTYLKNLEKGKEMGLKSAPISEKKNSRGTT